MSSADLAAFERIAGLVIVLDDEGTIVYWNRACVELSGRELDEVRGQPLRDVVPIPDAAAAQAFETRWTLPRGEQRTIAFVSAATMEESGRELRLLTGIDITPLVAHRESESDRLRALLELAPDGIFIADVEGRYLDVNDAGCRLVGYSKEELIGKSVTDLVLPEEIERLWQSREALLAGARHTAEWTLRRKDGSSVPVEVSAKILPDGRWQGFARDISERRRTQESRSRYEQALRESEERLRVSEEEQRFLADAGEILMIATPDYPATLTALGRLAVRDLADRCLIDVVEGGKIRRLKVGPAEAAKSSTLEALELDRRRPHLMFEPLEARRSTLVSDVTAAYLESVAQSGEHLEQLRALGMRSFIAVPLVARDRLLGALALISSRESRKYGESDLRLAEALAHVAALAVDNAKLYEAAQRALAARKEVLGVVAHDLRNPLNAIVLQLQLMQRRGAAPERRSQARVESIRRAALRINRLIEDILDVARLDSGALAVRCAPVAADSVIDEACAAACDAALDAGLRFATELPARLPEVLGDRHRLVRALDNLIGNAIKFTGPGGKIVVGASPRNGELLFWVQDTGPGIAPEHLEHLFDRFWQAERTDRRGAGLGLAIVKGIVDAHRGKIWVESEPGRGTAFYFTVPIARSQQPLAAAPDHDGHPGAGRAGRGLD